ARLREIDGGPGTIQTRTVDGGSCYLTQSEYALHFAGITPGRHYSLEVRYPNATGQLSVIDGSIGPPLADFTIDQFPYQDLFVCRDGRVKSQPLTSARVLAVASGLRPQALALGAPVPMPARDATVLPVTAANGRASLAIFDVTGRCVRTLLHESPVRG